MFGVWSQNVVLNMSLKEAVTVAVVITGEIIVL